MVFEILVLWWKERTEKEGDDNTEMAAEVIFYFLIKEHGGGRICSEPGLDGTFLTEINPNEP